MMEANYKPKGCACLANPAAFDLIAASNCGRMRQGLD